MSLENLEAELDAAFAIEWAQHEVLRTCVARYGREAVYVVWRLGWISGQHAGLTKAQEIMK